MKKPLILIALLCICVPVIAQEHETEQHKLVQFQLALLKREVRSAPRGGISPALRRQHMAYYQSLLTSGKALIAGPLQDDPQWSGVAIFNTKSADEARAWATADPAVAAGFFTIELHPWWSEDVFKRNVQPGGGPTTVYLALLVRGEKWTPGQTPENEAIQKAHLANIGRLAELKKLVVAGPFGDDGTLRGIFVFRVASLEEARTLAETDPAVKAGRLALQIHPWIVPDGILP
jgi:uncharacterized protein YciI